MAQVKLAMSKLSWLLPQMLVKRRLALHWLKFSRLFLMINGLTSDCYLRFSLRFFAVPSLPSRPPTMVLALETPT
jgi:hypothetical protein